MSGILCLSRMTLSQALSKALFHFQADYQAQRILDGWRLKFFVLLSITAVAIPGPSPC